MMRIFTLLVLVMTALVSCTSKLNPAYGDNEVVTNIYHRYEGETTANAQSGYAPISRKIEFEYQIDAIDSLTNVSVMVISGYNEGEINKPIHIELRNGDMIKLEGTGMVSREYVENYSYNTTTPRTSTHIVNDPGGTSIEVQPDGTHKHVHRPPSSKTVTTTENQVNTNHVSKSQLFNKCSVAFDKSTIDLIKRYGISRYILSFDDGELSVFVSKNQNKELTRYL